MALVCARCGTQNPDSNRFCQACGTPLAAPAPAQPATPVGPTAAAPFTTPPPPAGGTAGAPPPGPPPGYQSPYYTPAAGSPPPGVHRTPWVAIIAVIAGLIVIMAGCGTVLAFSGFGKTTANTGGFHSLSSPSPAGSPSPVPSQTPNQTATSVSNDSETVVIPSGWTVVNKDAQTITLANADGTGSITIGSGPSSPPATAAQNKSDIDAYFKQKFPDAKACPGTQASNGDLDGAKGIYWQVCFTATSGAQSISIGAPLFVGANASGTVYYAAFLETEVSNMDKFIAEAKAVLDGGIKWKLS
jgi:hypothetical protein